MAEPSDDIREKVLAKYAEAAHIAAAGRAPSCAPANEGGSCCGRAPVELKDKNGEQVFGDSLYAGRDIQGLAEAVVSASLGCGVPTAVADLQEGETVLDLGSGGGADVLISARRVGAGGKAIGLDMTAEMLDLARANAAAENVENVEFLRGPIEDIPLPDGSVDVVISNCVINLSGDKSRVLEEAARVLRAGGRFAVSDVVADPDMDQRTKADMEAWTGCVAGALTEAEFRVRLASAGFTEIEVRQSHRVHEHAASAIIRARKPHPDGCCSAAELGDCCEATAKSNCCGEADPREAPSSCGCST